MHLVPARIVRKTLVTTMLRRQDKVRQVDRAHIFTLLLAYCDSQLLLCLQSEWPGWMSVLVENVCGDGSMSGGEVDFVPNFITSAHR